MNFDLNLDRPILFLVALLVLGAWTIWVYARTRPSPDEASRRRLILIRVAASLLLALMLGGWSIEWTRSRAEAPGLIVLLDASASMSLPLDASDPAAPSRYEAALRIAEAMADEPGIRVRSFAFGEGLLAGPPPERPIAGFTDLGAALGDLPAQDGNSTLLMLSDGQDRGGALRFQEMRMPVLSVLLGDSLPQPDLRFGLTQAPAILPKDRAGVLRAEIQSVQGAPRAGKLRLSEGDSLILERDWSMDEGPGRIELELPLRFEEAGPRRIVLDLLAEGLDTRPENNRRVIGLDVLDEELDILVLAARPDWDLPFLMNALRGEKQLSTRLVIGGPGGIARLEDDGDPWTTEDSPDALIVHSLGPGWEEQLGEMDPGGILLLPGALSEPQLVAGMGLAASGRGERNGEFPLDWAPDAFRHEALGDLETLGPGLPPPPDLESLSSVNAPGLRTILESEGRPVLALRNWEGHRQAFLTGRGLYRWSLSGEEGREALAALYSGLVRWLARRDPPGRIRIQPVADAPREGRRVELRAELFDSDYGPVETGGLRWTLRSGDALLASGAFEAPFREGDDFAATLPALPAGDYEMILEARFPDGESLEEINPYAVLPDAGEFSRGESSPATLRWLAAGSGGRYFPEADLEAIREALPRETRLIERRLRLRVWDHPVFFLLFLGLLGLEWALRKRYGLV